MLSEASSSAIGNGFKTFLPFAAMRSINRTGGGGEGARGGEGGGGEFSDEPPGRLMRRLLHLLDIWRQANEAPPRSFLIRPHVRRRRNPPIPTGGRARILRFRYDALVWTGLPPTGSGSRGSRVSNILANNAHSRLKRGYRGSHRWIFVL